MVMGKTMVVNALDVCHRDCPWCAREFLVGWFQSRVRQMDILTKKAKDRGETVTFTQAAATSVRAP